MDSPFSMPGAQGALAAPQHEFPYERLLAFFRGELDAHACADVKAHLANSPRWLAHYDSLRSLDLERAAARHDGEALKRFVVATASPFCRAVAQTQGDVLLHFIRGECETTPEGSRQAWDEHVNRCPYCRRMRNLMHARYVCETHGVPIGELLLREWLLEKYYRAPLDRVTARLTRRKITATLAAACAVAQDDETVVVADDTETVIDPPARDDSTAIDLADFSAAAGDTNTVSVAELARLCLCGGSVFRVGSPEAARRAQALGAVGVLCDFAPPGRTLGAFRDVLDAISIPAMCWPTERTLLERTYRDKYGDEEPGGFFVLTAHDQPAARSDPCALAWTDAPAPWPAARRVPLFVLCRTVEEACSAVRAGADGTVLLFMPSNDAMDEIQDSTSNSESQVPHDRLEGERLIGVAALQGDYHLHVRALEAALARRTDHPPTRVVCVRSAAEFDAVDGLVLPGGWSNLQSRLMRRRGLDRRVGALRDRGVPILCVCAGMILARSRDGAGCEDRLALGLIDATVANNVVHGWREVWFADGRRQRLRFAKAPVVVERGSAVQVLAKLEDGTVVGAGQGRVQVFAFHDGIHEQFVDLCVASWAVQG